MEPVVSKTPLPAVLHLAFLFLIVFCTAFHVDLAQPVTDAFQEAEYATLGPLQRIQPGMRMPVLIHGGIDVYPSRLAARVCPADAQVVCVRIINTTLQVVAGWLLVALFATVAGLGTQGALFASAPLAALFWLFAGPAVLAADAQQAAPGIRDLAPLGALLLMSRIATILDRRRPGAGTLEIFLLGALAAASPFWVYNRGLVTIGVAVLFTLLICVARASLRPAILLGTGAVLAIAAIAIPAEPHLFADTLADIRYWAAHADLWRIRPQLRTIIPALALDAAAILVALPAGWSALRAGRPGRALMIAALVATGALYTVQSIGRSDMLHMRWTLWPPALVLAIGIRAHFDAIRPVAPVSAGLPLLAVLFGLLCLEVLSDRSTAYTTANGLIRNARLLGNPLPSDRALVAPYVRRTADLVRDAARCTFAADNAGIIHLLSGMPPCSRFMFGAYVAPDRQDQVIGELEATQPEIILWSAPDWWAHIDGYAFPDRSPRLAAWIEQNYPVQTSIGVYTLRSRHDLVATP